MTDRRDDKCWEQMVDEMRRALFLHPLNDEEAVAEYEAAPDIPLSNEELAEAVRVAASGVPKEKSYEERVTPSTRVPIDEEVGEVLGMFRNEGEMDDEVEEEMRRQREEALSDDNEEDAENGDQSEQS